MGHPGNAESAIPVTHTFALPPVARSAVSSGTLTTLTALVHDGAGTISSTLARGLKTDVCTRFGKGIYTSGTSSKSNDYQTNLRLSQWSALLLNNVVVGRGYQLYDNSDKLLQPPPGFDSVSVPSNAKRVRLIPLCRSLGYQDALLITTKRLFTATMRSGPHTWFSI